VIDGRGVAGLVDEALAELGSSVRCSAMTLSATLRPSLMSVARYITLMPPLPSTPSMR